VLTVNPVTPSPSSPTGQPTSDTVDDDGDRISITDVNGTVARFEMSYSPPARGSRHKFGPPLRSRIPSAVYLCGAVSLGAIMLYAYMFAPSSSRLFGWVVEGDRERPLPANVLTVIVLVSALATVLRTHMRGVLLSDDWVEARHLLPLGIPRARRWGWAQVLRIIVDDTRVAFELGDGSFERLPEVAKPRDLLSFVLEQAQRRRIDVTVLDRAIRH